MPTELEPHFTLLSTVLFAVGQTIGSGKSTIYIFLLFNMESHDLLRLPFSKS